MTDSSLSCYLNGRKQLVEIYSTKTNQIFKTAQTPSIKGEAYKYCSFSSSLRTAQLSLLSKKTIEGCRILETNANTNLKQSSKYTLSLIFLSLTNLELFTTFKNVDYLHEWHFYWDFSKWYSLYYMNSILLNWTLL